MKEEETKEKSRIICGPNIKSYFHEMVRNTASGRLSEHSAFYVGGVLTRAIKTDFLGEGGGRKTPHKALMVMYNDAAGASAKADKRTTLRALGDRALLISGMFADSRNRETMDIDYYIDRGGKAYGVLSAFFRRKETFYDLFSELSYNFKLCVDIIHEINEQNHHNFGMRNADPLRNYELWLKTGSSHAEKKLRETGIDPVSNSGERHYEH